MTTLIEKAKQEGLFHPDCPTTWIVQSYDHMIHAGWEYVRDGHATPKQAGAMAWTTLCQGLKRTKQ
jgi:hypothetical protein